MLYIFCPQVLLVFKISFIISMNSVSISFFVMVLVVSICCIPGIRDPSFLPVRAGYHAAGVTPRPNPMKLFIFDSPATNIFISSFQQAAIAEDQAG